MEFFYCFANASLTQRVSAYLLTKIRRYLDSVTVIFLNDSWVMRLRLKPTIDIECRNDSLAFLSENGIPIRPTSLVIAACNDLDMGSSVTAVMNRYQIAIVSHGVPAPAEVKHFQEQFVTGLGYRPQSLA